MGISCASRGRSFAVWQSAAPYVLAMRGEINANEVLVSKNVLLLPRTRQ